jgi:hypothetical protein
MRDDDWRGLLVNLRVALLDDGLSSGDICAGEAGGTGSGVEDASSWAEHLPGLSREDAPMKCNSLSEIMPTCL